MSYNGWTNYETWCVNLHLTNAQHSDSYWRSEAQDAWDNPGSSEVWTHSEAARYTLADRLKDQIAEEPDTPYAIAGTLYSDLLNAALSEVNWNEIADGFLSDVDGYEPIEAAAEGDPTTKEGSP